MRILLVITVLALAACTSTRQYTNPTTGCVFTTTKFQTGVWDQSKLDITCPEQLEKKP